MIGDVPVDKSFSRLLYWCKNRLISIVKWLTSPFDGI